MKTNKTNTGTGYKNHNTHGQGYRNTHTGYCSSYENGQSIADYFHAELTSLEREARREQAKEAEREALMNYRAMKQAFRDMKSA